jgi:hypothetical protein
MPPGRTEILNWPGRGGGGRSGRHKGLYSTSFYSEEEFWAAYNGPAYARLKSAYDAAGRLSGLYEKCVRGR